MYKESLAGLITPNWSNNILITRWCTSQTFYYSLDLHTPQTPHTLIKSWHYLPSMLCPDFAPLFLPLSPFRSWFYGIMIHAQLNVYFISSPASSFGTWVRRRQAGRQSVGTPESVWAWRPTKEYVCAPPMNTLFLPPQRTAFWVRVYFYWAETFDYWLFLH